MLRDLLQWRTFSTHTVLVHSCRKCAYWLVKNMSWLCSHCLNSLIIYFGWLPESTFDINNAVSTWGLFPCKMGGRRLWPLSSRLIWVVLNQSYMYPHTHKKKKECKCMQGCVSLGQTCRQKCVVQRCKQLRRQVILVNCKTSHTFSVANITWLPVYLSLKYQISWKKKTSSLQMLCSCPSLCSSRLNSYYMFSTEPACNHFEKLGKSETNNRVIFQWLKLLS